MCDKNPSCKKYNILHITTLRCKHRFHLRLCMVRQMLLKFEVKIVLIIGVSNITWEIMPEIMSEFMPLSLKDFEPCVLTCGTTKDLLVFLVA